MYVIVWLLLLIAVFLYSRGVFSPERTLWLAESDTFVHSDYNNR